MRTKKMRRMKRTRVTESKMECTLTMMMMTMTTKRRTMLTMKTIRLLYENIVSFFSNSIKKDQIEQKISVTFRRKQKKLELKCYN